MREVDPDVLSATAELEFPYQHSTGPVIGRFLTSLRDHRRILGIRCGVCDIVQVPPQEYCERCAAPVDEWREVASEGTVRTFAVVRHAQAIHRLDPPFAFALIRLDGADTDLLHVVRCADYDGLRTGTRVRAVWREAGEGTIWDLDHFVPDDEEETA